MSQSKLHDNGRGKFAINVADVSDSKKLSKISTQTFIESFENLYSSEDLKYFIEHYHSREWYETHLTDPDFKIWLVVSDDGDAMGYAVGGRCQLPVEGASDTSGEIKRIYVLAKYQSFGIGRILLETMLDWFAAEQYNPVFLSVYSGNVAAQRFYKRYGFEHVGDNEFVVGKQRDHDFIFSLTR